MEWPSLVHKPCCLCGTNPAHPCPFCLKYKCPHCHLYALEHTPSQCKRWPCKFKWLNKVKEELVPPAPFNWEHNRYYEIEGYKDGNLNRENWPPDSYGPKDQNIPLTLIDSPPLYIKALTPTMDYQNSPLPFLTKNASLRMPLCESPQPIILSDKYYLPGGTYTSLLTTPCFVFTDIS